MKGMYSICIIDDDPIVNYGFRKLASQLSDISKVQNFESAIDALNHLKPLIQSNHQTLPDIIFLDINMPLMDGWQFIEAFTAMKEGILIKEIKLILLSSSIDVNDHKKAEELSVVDQFIVKPITKEKLEHCLSDN